jgi:hypothetical protein
MLNQVVSREEWLNSDLAWSDPAHRALTGPGVSASIRLCLLEISRDFLKSVEWAGSHPSYIQAHKSADDCAHRRKHMQFALLIYESPEAFATRQNDKSDSYTGAWRAYHKALVESGIFVGGDPLQVPETGTTVRLKEGKRRVQDGPYADTKEQLGGFTILELPSLDAALDWAGRCPAASYGAVEVRPLAPELKRRITE